MLGVVLVFELLGSSYLVFCGLCVFCCMLFDFLGLMLHPFAYFWGEGAGLRPTAGAPIPERNWTNMPIWRIGGWIVPVLTVNPVKRSASLFIHVP